MLQKMQLLRRKVIFGYAGVVKKGKTPKICQAHVYMFKDGRYQELYAERDGCSAHIGRQVFIRFDAIYLLGIHTFHPQ